MIWLLYWTALLIGFVIEGIIGAVLLYFFWWLFTGFLFLIRLSRAGLVLNHWNAYKYLLRRMPRNLEAKDGTRYYWPLWWFGEDDA